MVVAYSGFLGFMYCLVCLGVFIPVFLV